MKDRLMSAAIMAAVVSYYVVREWLDFNDSLDYIFYGK